MKYKRHLLDPFTGCIALYLATGVSVTLPPPWFTGHQRTNIVPHIKFDMIGGTSSATFSNFKYVAPIEGVIKFFRQPVSTTMK